ncbi:hypothetical protein QLQ12_36290 [Actinoplanes sp. NEAU-A12]|uniref:Uncharacterized protein n=1 Tax=Actinoplanes sandaracinus TaxID=3045177 RepID=A0ABT6WWG5_9ACTN|nr:hypothetical protein [Actinoplanes sandaracinus]MDI6104065.1 hypothetical protein [Actinoplanes sandaracinus]
MTEDDVAESVIDRLLWALAAQLSTSTEPALTPDAIDALSNLSRAEAKLIFGQAGHLVHYGADTEALEALIHLITAVQRDEAPVDAAVKPGDQVRLVGELPESLAEYDETSLRETVFVVRYVSRAPTVEVQTDLTEDYLIETVPATALRLSS